jgi:RHS repeat-associated protein
MRSKSVLSLTVISLSFLMALMLFVVPVCISQAHADTLELNQITEAITQKKVHWLPRDTSLSRLDKEYRTKRLGSAIPAPTGREKVIVSPAVSVPLRLDWRNYNGTSYVTPVKDQGQCASGWAFATTAALESNALIAGNTPGIPLDLSEQALASCSGAGNCHGGRMDFASDFIRDVGLPPENCYPYTSIDSFCSDTCPEWPGMTYTMSDWYRVDPTIESIRYSLYNYGPLVVLMAVHTDFFYYGSGVYTHAWGSLEGYHSALIVGYDDAGQYFVVKDSWGTDWGENGYLRIAYSEIGSETIFGCWTIAYKNDIPAGFPVIDGVPRNTAGTDKDNAGKQEPLAASFLEGTVKDTSNNAIGNASMKTGQYSAASDDNGQYRLSSIPPGDYVVAVSKDGYSTVSENVALRAGATVTKDFVLSGTAAADNTKEEKTTDAGKEEEDKTQQQGPGKPGWMPLRGPQITPDQAEVYFSKKMMKRIMEQPLMAAPAAAGATETSPEIGELARALRHDPKLIYNYVHQNIDYLPYFGSLKGATLTYLDGSGNDFDQASLMIALLRASGYSARYVYGTVTLNISTVDLWLRNTYHAYTLANGGIPFTTDSQTYCTITRVWVAATIDGTDYVFDPALKAYTENYEGHIDLASDMKYNYLDFIVSAITGAALGSDYAQNINEKNIKTKLTYYTSNYIAARRAEGARQDTARYLGSSYRVIPDDLTTYSTSLPYPASVTAIWDEIPPEYTATLRVQYSGIDHTFAIPDIGGRRITITYTSSNYRPELCLEGTLIASGNATTPGSYSIATFTINHGTATNNGYYASQAATSSLKSGGTYALISNFAGTPRSTLIQKRQEQLNRYLLQGMTADTDKEKVLGETLNIMGLTYFNEIVMQEELMSAGIISGGALPVMFHAIGIMGQNTGPYIDISAWASALNYAYDSYDRNNYTLFQTMMFHGSGFEHSILEQFMGSDKPGASTVKVLQLANAKGYKIFQADNTNYQSIKQQLKGYTSAALAGIDAKRNEGFDVFVLPEYGDLTLGQWQGYGYMARDSNWVSGMYVGNYNGGIGQYIPVDPVYTAKQTNIWVSVDTPLFFSTSVISDVPTYQSKEPVDMASGAYLYDHTDLSLGSGAPLGLSLNRSYNTNNSAKKTGFGYGWAHNNDISLTTASHAGPMIGKRQVTEAAPFVVAGYIINNIMQNESHVKDSVISAIIAKWAMDQINDNSVTVQAGNKNMEFIRLPDDSYSAPPGITTQLTKNTDGTFSLTERSGTRTTFNTDNRIGEIKDIDGNTMTFAYNTNKNLVSLTDAHGRALTFAYSGDSISSVSDSTGRSVSYVYDVNGNLTGYTDPEGKVWGYGYDDEHRMTSLSNPLNITTAVNAYDGLGRVKTQTVPRQGNKTATYSFYFSGVRNQEEDPAGGVITYYYDEKGRGYADANPLGNKTTKEFDGQDHIVSVINPRSYKTTYEYDNDHNLKAITNTLGTRINNAYDSYFRLTQVTDPLGNTARFSYDVRHHLIGTSDPMGNTTDSTYYADGLVSTATDARGTPIAFTYDTWGNPRTASTGNHPAVTSTYDSAGRLIEFIDQAGLTTTFAYDKRGLPTNRTDPLGRTVSFEYDGAGRLIAKKDRNNRIVTYTYTATSKPETITYPDGSSVRFTYDLLDNLISMQDVTGTTCYSYDAAGRLISLTDPRGFVISYGYDEAGNMTELTYPGNKKVLYSYDAVNRLETIRWQDQTARYAYDVVGRPIGLTHFNGSTTAYAYDKAGRLTALDNCKPGSCNLPSDILSRYEFTLDSNGNRTGVVQEEPYGTTLSNEHTSYTYNLLKNRLLTAGGDSFTYDDEGQLTNGYSTTYAFDNEHRLVGIGDNVRFTYDGKGNRIEAIRNGIVTRYIYDAGGNILAEADENNTITRYYIYGRGLIAMVSPAQQQDQVFCYHFNAVGSTIAITDNAGAIVNSYVYDPFGKIANQHETVQQPFTFVGQYGVMTEQNGFYYMRARYYDPNVGRFISEDPIGFEGGDVNLYAYAGNNPVMMIDPSGKAAFWYHFADGYRAGSAMGRSTSESLKLGWAAMTPDFNELQNISWAHATTDDPLRSSQAVINEALIHAENAWNSDNIEGMGLAIHIWRDIASHAGSYFPNPASTWDYIEHIVKYDLLPGGSFENVIGSKINKSCSK